MDDKNLAFNKNPHTKVTLENSVKRNWGNNCIAYELLNQSDLHIHYETMPPNSAEVKHYHANKNQFFYCLEGDLIIEIGNKIFELSKNQSLYVEARLAHTAKNVSDANVMFLVIADNNYLDRIEL